VANISNNTLTGSRAILGVFGGLARHFSFAQDII
jgi:phage shock protein PspC (stress-responsive transcriptional regulator)